MARQWYESSRKTNFVVVRDKAYKAYRKASGIASLKTSAANESNTARAHAAAATAHANARVAADKFNATSPSELAPAHNHTRQSEFHLAQESKMATKPAINRAFRIANNIPVEAKVNRLNGNHKIVTTAMRNAGGAGDKAVANYSKAAFRASGKSSVAQGKPYSVPAQREAMQAHTSAALAAEKVNMHSSTVHADAMSHVQSADHYRGQLRFLSSPEGKVEARGQRMAARGGLAEDRQRLVAVAKKTAIIPQERSTTMSRLQQNKALGATAEHADSYGRSAYKANTPEMHQQAANFHNVAARKYAEVGGHEANVAHHTNSAAQHLNARDRAQAKPHGGEPGIDKRTGMTRGTMSDPGNRGEVNAMRRDRTSVSSINRASAYGKGSDTKTFNSVARGEHPNQGLSDKAAFKSASANAKPSLMGHISAAKAHEAAAASYGPKDAVQAKYHTDAAANHRAQAKIVSHQIQAKRILKIKVAGPGQVHGAGGRFTGVAGGAKK